MRVAIVAHARLHTFDLARALLQRGHDVLLVTNEPPARARGWGIPDASVRSYAVEGRLHGAAARLPPALYGIFERAFHTLFGAWAARQLEPGPWDLVMAFSGVAEESLALARARGWPTLCARGSAHIRIQDALLQAEERRTGIRMQRPSRWRVAREEREYHAADHVYVPSTFARESFLEAGFPAERVGVFRYGVDVEAFSPPAGAVAERRRRILAGAPLAILFAGSLALRKGAFDIARAVRALEGQPFTFHFVGGVSGDAKQLAATLPAAVRFTPRVAQADLPACYAAADLFLLPSIEDGFAVVLAQAAAAAVPMITTPHTAGPDLVEHDRTGWIVPVGDAAAIVALLRRLEADRPAVAAAVDALAAEYRPRAWSALAADLEAHLLARGGRS